MCVFFLLKAIHFTIAYSKNDFYFLYLTYSLKIVLRLARRRYLNNNDSTRMKFVWKLSKANKRSILSDTPRRTIDDVEWKVKPFSIITLYTKRARECVFSIDKLDSFSSSSHCYFSFNRAHYTRGSKDTRMNEWKKIRNSQSYKSSKTPSRIIVAIEYVSIVPKKFDPV